MPGRFLSLLFSLLLVGAARAQTQDGVELVQASLVARPAEAGAATDAPIRVGVRLVMAPHWHTYWQNAGDYGLPTEIEWKLPPGWSAGPILWPLPERITQGDIVTFGYEREVLLLTDLTPPPGGATAEAPGQIGAKASWLVCKESCVPGDAELKLSNPARGPDAALAALFATAAKQLPKPFGPAAGFTVARALDAKGLTLTVRGLPPTTATKLDFYPVPGDAEVSLVAPKIETTTDGYRIRIELGQPSKKHDGVWGVLAFERNGLREGWTLQPKDFVTGGSVAAPGANTPAAATADQGSLLHFLFLGFLGGLILNAMPCVLPVLSLKIFSFMQQAGEEPGRVFRLGLAYSAGVFAWFLGIAGMIIGLQAAGQQVSYGMQFGNAGFVIGLIVLIFIFALSLLGVFEFTLPGSIQNSAAEASQQHGYAGAFFQGLLATILGASCTAPLLGPALGFALQQTPVVIVGMFAMVGLGMASPVLLLCRFPAWMKFLPRPGAWMEHFKQLTGFVMLGTIVFLLYVVGSLKGPDGMVWTMSLLLVLGIACWLYGAFLTPSSPAGTRVRAGLVIVILLLLGGGFTILQIRSSEARGSEPVAAEKGGIPWEKYSAARLDAAIAAKQPVFIDFTADWCVNCKWNEKTVLETDAVRAALREKGFLALKGDWTRSDPEITKVLRKHRRAGVPLYLVFGPGQSEPQVLPELLTRQIVVEALNVAVPAKSQAAVSLPDPPAGGR